MSARTSSSAASPQPSFLPTYLLLFALSERNGSATSSPLGNRQPTYEWRKGNRTMNVFTNIRTLFVLPAVLLTAGVLPASASAQTLFAPPAASVPVPSARRAPVYYSEGAYTRVQNYRPATVAHLEQPRLQQPRQAAQQVQRFTGRIQAPQRYSNVPVRLAVHSYAQTRQDGFQKPVADTTPAPEGRFNRTLLDARLMTGRVLR